tara:strand:+ start:27654 stop:27980 length:327 start_codon:yes stop_codon:yes gene_type:complete
MSIPFDDIEKAFETSNAEKIMSLGKSKVLISIDGKEGVYSKSQGTQVLKNFFKKHPPKSFDFDFKGKESGATSFAVGKYYSDKVFRVSIKMKKQREEFAIESIAIAEN